MVDNGFCKLCLYFDKSVNKNIGFFVVNHYSNKSVNKYMLFSKSEDEFYQNADFVKSLDAFNNNDVIEPIIILSGKDVFEVDKHFSDEFLMNDDYELLIVLDSESVLKSIADNDYYEAVLNSIVKLAQKRVVNVNLSEHYNMLYSLFNNTVDKKDSYQLLFRMNAELNKIPHIIDEKQRTLSSFCIAQNTYSIYERNNVDDKFKKLSSGLLLLGVNADVMLDYKNLIKSGLYLDNLALEDIMSVYQGNIDIKNKNFLRI